MCDPLLFSLFWCHHTLCDNLLFTLFCVGLGPITQCVIPYFFLFFMFFLGAITQCDHLLFTLF